MSYPRSLDEFTDRELLTETKRREKLRAAGLCTYCGRAFDEPACKFVGRHHEARPRVTVPKEK